MKVDIKTHNEQIHSWRNMFVERDEIIERNYITSFVDTHSSSYAFLLLIWNIFTRIFQRPPVIRRLASHG